MHTKRAHINCSLEISREKMDSPWTMPYAHYHNSYELYILTSGERIVTIDEVEYETAAGDVAIFPPGHPHSSKGTTPFSGICIHFSESYMKQHFGENARQLLLDCFHKHVVHLSSTELAIIENIVDSFQTESAFSFLQLGQILEQIHTALKHNKKETSLSNAHRQNSKASQICNYINENYIYIQTVSEIAAHFLVSEGYVFRVCKEAFATSPKEYINGLRLEHFLHRLRYSDKPIKTLAAQSGFTCYEYFIRLFKENYGCTPGNYRERMRKPLT